MAVNMDLDLIACPADLEGGVCGSALVSADCKCGSGFGLLSDNESFCVLNVDSKDLGQHRRV